MNDPRAPRTRADVRRSAWPGWIWIVPVATLGVVGWLGIRAMAERAETVTVVFSDAHGMKVDDTEVTLRGVRVGNLSGITLTPDGRHVEATLSIARAEKKYLRSGTRFFLRGAQPEMSDPASLRALVVGPEIVMEPGPGKPERHFDGTERRPALAPQHGPVVPFVVRFAGAAGELKDGAPVKLRGFQVGTVTRVRLSYDVNTGRLGTPVQIALEPAALGITGVQPPADGNWRAIVDGMLGRLVAQGLRARLVQDPPVVGARLVSLDFVGGAPAATLATGHGPPEIPSVESADFDAIADRAHDIAGKIDALPIKETGDAVRSIAARINALAASPQLRDSLAHIDRSVAQIDRTLQQVSPQIGPLVAQLRDTANAADQAVASANRTLGGDATAQNSLPAALRELTDTARSVRALADYLDRHPEALVRGRREEKP
ncbi:mammalian cell entry protein [Burkholderia sp. Nafp2/4-1b]|uniref:MlaD family protein n=1 Tax=Burkholderia sp. Nafp2/4-1b TaxID=2116686 RepID=UPI000EF8A7A2|nr:MlaD family protein [Burkholderia sp. Nafp2/4-1b]RKU01171.1 mammalian cell entry protein [Burkholderia sp. Nafp2/4-1b]